VPFVLTITISFLFFLSKLCINLPVLQGKMSHVLPVRTKGRRNVFSSRVVSARTQKSAPSLEQRDECNQYQAKEETLRKRRFLSSSSSRFLVRNTRRRHISQESSKSGKKEVKP
jgi:ribosomal protein S30